MEQVTILDEFHQWSRDRKRGKTRATFMKFMSMFQWKDNDEFKDFTKEIMWQLYLTQKMIADNAS